MPGGNKKGPTGKGPMTGRKLGYCVGNDVAGFQNTNDDIAYGYRNRGGGRGLGRGFGNMHAINRGLGRGYGRALNQNQNAQQNKGLSSVENEIDSLKKRLKFLEDQLKKDSN